jgi:hypothetical protein
MNAIKLNFINRSADTNKSSIVIFQQNVAEDFGELAVAWKVIENCGRSDNHPFAYSMNFEVSGRNSYGNYTPLLTASNGQAFDMLKDASGDTLFPSKVSAASPNQVEIRNKLASGAINANCYRDGKLLAVKSGLAPGQKAVFEFQPRIYIGVVFQIEEGDIMNSAIVSQVKSQIDLIGITSADIVMTGGGSGNNAVPFEFTLENINT